MTFELLHFVAPCLTFLDPHYQIELFEGIWKLWLYIDFVFELYKKSIGFRTKTFVLCYFMSFCLWPLLLLLLFFFMNKKKRGKKVT